MRVNILGTKYKVKFLDYESYQNHTLVKELDFNTDGVCDDLKKLILVRDCGNEELNNLTLRHEIIHAFQFESGIMHSWDTKCWDKESETDWMAVQFPKIQKVFKELNI